MAFHSPPSFQQSRLPRVVAATKTGWSPGVSSTSTTGRPPPASSDSGASSSRGMATAADLTRPRKGSWSTSHATGRASTRPATQIRVEPRPTATDVSSVGAGDRCTRRQPSSRPAGGASSRSDRVQAAGAGDGPSPIRSGHHQRSPLEEGERQAGVRLGGQREATPPGGSADDRRVHRVDPQPPGPLLEVRGEHVGRAGIQHRSRPHGADRLQRVSDGLARRARELRAGPDQVQAAVGAASGQPVLDARRGTDDAEGVEDDAVVADRRRVDGPAGRR